MQILLIAATKSEIEPLNALPGYVDIEITGVGCPAALYQLQKKLYQTKYDLIIQAGIAGTFNNKFKPGDVVIVRQDTFADIGMEECAEFTSIYQTGFADKNKFPFTDGWLVNEDVYVKNLNLPLANAVTINKISDSEFQKKQLIKNFTPDIETMEGAALHYVCLQENIPFLQIRSISNEVGIRDKSKWKMKDAIINLNEEIEKLIMVIDNSHLNDSVGQG
jgi:futalosine hydrolase